ncbi:MAG: NADAR family protein [Myxococcaceae bacterium]|nr:NADAR family protein [Myxococcaceae bacterium]
MPWTRETLAQHLDGGANVDWLFFWGHTPKDPAVVDKSCLSQWFPRGFTVDGVDYPSAEHFMMASKARVFGDAVTEQRIIAAKSPEDAKALGRQVSPFDAETWAREGFAHVVMGNVAKFTQHPDLKAFLLATGDKVLVEAAPRDLIWGIGLAADNPLAKQPRKWRGKNQLGFALMEARAQLK